MAAQHQPSPIVPPAAAAVTAILEAIAAAEFFKANGRLPDWAMPHPHDDERRAA